MVHAGEVDDWTITDSVYTTQFSTALTQDTDQYIIFIAYTHLHVYGYITRYPNGWLSTR